MILLFGLEDRCFFLTVAGIIVFSVRGRMTLRTQLVLSPAFDTGVDLGEGAPNWLAVYRLNSSALVIFLEKRTMPFDRAYLRLKKVHFLISGTMLTVEA